ncbi:MAG: YbhB/YbcL family Raf kinase inhibitor-like protein [Candidatus Margulisbacteria bacterium]|nr:YbhB/YbcL family Raf kinase inhibitor-like protein [Candidatus Margulisiibacteriota bacterium]
MIKYMSIGLLLLASLSVAQQNNTYQKNSVTNLNNIPLTSPAFKNGEMIPAKYTCDNKTDISPQLIWKNLPKNTKSVALIMDDPDTTRGTFVHWVIYNIPADQMTLPEGIIQAKELPNGGRQGLNGAKSIGYKAPCPPNGIHRYFFKFYALDTVFETNSDLTKDDLLKLMNSHILATGQLMGKYKRLKE